jgi:hypothetical protein
MNYWISFGDCYVCNLNQFYPHIIFFMHREHFYGLLEIKSGSKHIKLC